MAWWRLARAAPAPPAGRLLRPQRQPFFAYARTSPAVPSLVEEAVREETRRQRDELMLIPSESICYPECNDVLASPFGNIYAEGQPDLRMHRSSPALATDKDYFQAWHRRLSDGRFYRGCDQADRVELLAQHYVAVAFSRLKGSPPPDHIFANIQALSGSPANLAIYSGLLQRDSRLLTLHLSHGGHLSHGSPFNVSGKYYPTKHYSIDPTTRKLDYDAIHRIASEWRPAMIVGGASAYSWDWDWQRLREIADDVGALLHADVCHLAGLIVGGQLNNPLPFSDTVMFTTHKTLMGPRGAVIVTKDPAMAKRIDNAVFPGMQVTAVMVI
jgi:glycine hydroxymethyltransferase